MEIEIRQAAPADLDLLMKWRMAVLHEVFALPAGAPTEKLEQANRLYYRTALETGEHIACFACAGDTVIGCGGVCLYREMPSPDNPSGQCAYLMNIYTLPACRHSGAGRAIVTWLRQKARDRGIRKIYLESAAPARGFYKKLGFTDMDGYMQAPGI